MKKNWRVVMIIIALSIVFGSGSGVSAQEAPIVGGYADISSSDAEVVSAAKYAIRARARRQGTRISLISIGRAEVQVVAGLNYRLHLRVRINGRTEDVAAVVYKNLKNRYSLSSWEPNGNRAGRDKVIQRDIRLSIASTYGIYRL